MRTKKSVFLLCWNSWDYDHHEEPQEAYLSRARVKLVLRPQEAYLSRARAKLALRRKGRDTSYQHGGSEGWSIMEVELLK